MCWIQLLVAPLRFKFRAIIVWLFLLDEQDICGAIMFLRGDQFQVYTARDTRPVTKYADPFILSHLRMRHSRNSVRQCVFILSVHGPSLESV
ncbi:hypothetical protein IW262DRAFT_996790 [Armillaria fumosa]|nr:hypothetical protein IW262DRAFT_996790 [Armillaria fumosa]